MPTWKESLRNLLKQRRAHIILLLGAAAFLFTITQWPHAFAALEFNDVTGDSLQNLFFSLLLITIFMERAQEIYVFSWRAEGRSKRESDLRRASSGAAKTKAERELDVYKSETRRYVALGSSGAAIIISLAGVRVLAPLVSTPAVGMQQSWLFAVDVVLTAGLLAGGSMLIHEVMAIVGKALEMTKGKIAS